MKRAALMLALTVGFVAPGLSATHEYEGHTVTIAPGQAHEQVLACAAGRLLSGGYDLDNVNRGGGPMGKVLVVANSPIPDSRWRVIFYNDHDAPVLVDFRISVLCE